MMLSHSVSHVNTVVIQESRLLNHRPQVPEQLFIVLSSIINKNKIILHTLYIVEEYKYHNNIEVTWYFGSFLGIAPW